MRPRSDTARRRSRMPKPTRVKLAEINPHIVCSLCNGYLVDATTIMECLHSFCRRCIIRYLETNNFCPVCDVQVHKTRPLSNLRPDTLLQDLVYKLVPGLYKDEMYRRREFWRSHRDTAGSHTPTKPESRGEILEYRLLFSQQESISIVLQHSPRTSDKKERKLQCKAEKSDDKRYLLCPSRLSVGHLQKFIRSKFDLDSKYEIEVLYSGNTLEEDVTLMEIAYVYGWSKERPLKLQYVVAEKLPTADHVSKDRPDHVTRLRQNSTTGRASRKTGTAKQRISSSWTDGNGSIHTGATTQKMARKSTKKVHHRHRVKHSSDRPKHQSASSVNTRAKDVDLKQRENKLPGSREVSKTSEHIRGKSRVIDENKPVAPKESFIKDTIQDKAACDDFLSTPPPAASAENVTEHTTHARVFNNWDDLVILSDSEDEGIKPEPQSGHDETQHTVDQSPVGALALAEKHTRSSIRGGDKSDIIHPNMDCLENNTGSKCESHKLDKSYPNIIHPSLDCLENKTGSTRESRKPGKSDRNAINPSLDCLENKVESTCESCPRNKSDPNTIHPFTQSKKTVARNTTENATAVRIPASSCLREITSSCAVARNSNDQASCCTNNSTSSKTIVTATCSTAEYSQTDKLDEECTDKLPTCCSDSMKDVFSTSSQDVGTDKAPTTVTECCSDDRCDTESCDKSNHMINNNQSNKRKVEKNNNNIRKSLQCENVIHVLQESPHPIRTDQMNHTLTCKPTNNSAEDTTSSTTSVHTTTDPKPSNNVPSLSRTRNAENKSLPKLKTQHVLQSKVNYQVDVPVSCATTILGLKSTAESTPVIGVASNTISKSRTQIASFMQLPKLALTSTTPLKMKVVNTTMPPPDTSSSKSAPIYSTPVTFASGQPIQVISAPVTAFLPIYTKQPLQKVVQIPIQISRSLAQSKSSTIQPRASSASGLSLAEGGSNNGPTGKTPLIITKTSSQAKSPICVLAQFTLNNSLRVVNTSLTSLAKPVSGLKEIVKTHNGYESNHAVEKASNDRSDTLNCKLTSSVSSSPDTFSHNDTMKAKLRLLSLASATKANVGLNKSTTHTTSLTVSVANTEHKLIDATTFPSSTGGAPHTASQIQLKTPTQSHSTTPEKQQQSISCIIPHTNTDQSFRNIVSSHELSALVTPPTNTTQTTPPKRAVESLTGFASASVGTRLSTTRSAAGIGKSANHTMHDTVATTVTTTQACQSTSTEFNTRTVSSSKTSTLVPILCNIRTLLCPEIQQLASLQADTAPGVRPVASSVLSKSTIPDASPCLRPTGSSTSRTTPIVDVNKAPQSKSTEVSCPTTSAQEITTCSTLTPVVRHPPVCTQAVTTSSIQAPILKEALSRPPVRATTTQALLSPRKKYTPMKLGPSGPILPQHKNCTKELQEIHQPTTTTAQMALDAQKDTINQVTSANVYKEGPDPHTTITDSQLAIPHGLPQAIPSPHVTRSLSFDNEPAHPGHSLVQQTVPTEESCPNNTLKDGTQLCAHLGNTSVEQLHHPSPTRKVPDYTRYRNCVVTTKLANHGLGRERSVPTATDSTKGKDVYSFEDTTPSTSPANGDKSLCKDKHQPKRELDGESKKSRKRKKKTKLEPLCIPKPHTFVGHNDLVAEESLYPKVTYEILSSQEADALTKVGMESNNHFISYAWKQSSNLYDATSRSNVHMTDSLSTTFNQQVCRGNYNQNNSESKIKKSASSSSVPSSEQSEPSSYDHPSPYQNDGARMASNMELSKEPTTGHSRKCHKRQPQPNPTITPVYDQYKDSKLFRALSHVDSFHQTHLWDDHCRQRVGVQDTERALGSLPNHVGFEGVKYTKQKANNKMDEQRNTRTINEQQPEAMHSLSGHPQQCHQIGQTSTTHTFPLPVVYRDRIYTEGVSLGTETNGRECLVNTSVSTPREQVSSGCGVQNHDMNLQSENNVSEINEATEIPDISSVSNVAPDDALVVNQRGVDECCVRENQAISICAVEVSMNAKNPDVEEHVSKLQQNTKSHRILDLPRPSSAPPLQKSTPLHKQLYPHPEQLPRNNIIIPHSVPRKSHTSDRVLNNRSNQDNANKDGPAQSPICKSTKSNSAFSDTMTSGKSPPRRYSPITPESSPGLPTSAPSHEAAAAAVSLITMGMGYSQQAGALVKDPRPSLSGSTTFLGNTTSNNQFPPTEVSGHVNEMNFAGSYPVQQMEETFKGKQTNQNQASSQVITSSDNVSVTRTKPDEVETPPIKKLKLMCNGISFDQSIQANKCVARTGNQHNRYRKKNCPQVSEFMDVSTGTSNTHVQKTPGYGVCDAIYVKGLTNGHNFPYLNQHPQVSLSSQSAAATFGSTVRAGSLPYSFYPVQQTICDPSLSYTERPVQQTFCDPPLSYTERPVQVRPAATISTVRLPQTLADASLTSPSVPTSKRAMPPSAPNGAELPSARGPDKVLATTSTHTHGDGYDQPLELTTKTARDRHKERESERKSSNAT